MTPRGAGSPSTASRWGLSTPRAWQRQVAVVFQDFARYPLSLAENVGLGAFEHLHAARPASRRAVAAGRRPGPSWPSCPGRRRQTVLSAQYERRGGLSGVASGSGWP